MQKAVFMNENLHFDRRQVLRHCPPIAVAIYTTPTNSEWQSEFLMP
jgi:hypothetical protein